MPKASANTSVLRAAYQAPAFLIDTTELDFDIRTKETRVRSRLRLTRNPAHPVANAPLVLNGEAQKLISVTLNGISLSEQNYELTPHSLTIQGVPDAFYLEIESSNDPSTNTALSGLYAAGKILGTQCEPEGFRRITYYPDRPDVMAKFTVTIHADKKRFPVLLSNGNLIGSGDEGAARHWVRWEDPFRKPAYLFALVAGKLDKVQDRFVTKSGRKVLIEIYVDPGKADQTDFARAAIKKAMKWDEEAFGLEYDLDRFMLVAIGAFNSAAMENKGLNIFNDSYVLGRAETATDSTIAFIERVIGHEYFHNWTGDRITCRDWFQLSLKEGLTVFREQEFCGAMTAPALERLHTVAILRRAQFPEDAGAMAHAVRPDSYESIENFYTTTVYEKGAEVVRMIQTIVGKRGFQKGMKLYVKRHDGQAATCDQFVAAMADANKIDLTPFMQWYSQAGTPTVKAKGVFDAKKKTYTLTLAQKTKPTAGQPRKKSLHIPFAVGLLNARGKDMIGTQVLHLTQAKQSFVFKNITEQPVPSLLRTFSAPVRLEVKLSDAELLFLMAHDSDAFNRWEAGQKLFLKYLLKPTSRIPAAFIDALRAVLVDKKLDSATKALSLSLPSEAEIGLALRAQNKLIDPIAVYEKRQAVTRQIVEGLVEELWQTYVDLESALDATASDGVARGDRTLKNLCLAYLAKILPDDAAPLAAESVAESTNMTDKAAALSILADIGGKLADKSLALFEKKYRAHPSIMDEWLSTQAAVRSPRVLATVKKLTQHPAFTYANPNRVSALIGVFAGNPLGFHAVDGSGYKFVADSLIKLDKINANAAGRIGKVFLRLRDFDAKRQKMMLAQVKRVAAVKDLSPTLREVITKSLKG